MEIPDITVELLEQQGVATAKDRAIEKAEKTEGKVESVKQVGERFDPIEPTPQYAQIIHTWEIEFSNGIKVNMETISYGENPDWQPTPVEPETESQE